MVKVGYLRYSIGRGVPKTLQKLPQLHTQEYCEQPPLSRDLGGYVKFNDRNGSF